MKSLTVTQNHWRVPSEERAFDGWLEGIPTEKQKQQILREVRLARSTWKPGKEAMNLVARLQEYIGYWVRIEFWDPIMFMLDDEGPNPIEATLHGVDLIDTDGFLQAYLRIAEINELAISRGYPSGGYLKPMEDGIQMASLADLYRISTAG